jgi:hypothetical protein
MPGIAPRQGIQGQPATLKEFVKQLAKSAQHISHPALQPPEALAQQHKAIQSALKEESDYWVSRINNAAGTKQNSYTPVILPTDQQLPRITLNSGVPQALAFSLKRLIKYYAHLPGELQTVQGNGFYISNTGILYPQHKKYVQSIQRKTLKYMEKAEAYRQLPPLENPTRPEIRARANEGLLRNTLLDCFKHLDQLEAQPNKKWKTHQKSVLDSDDIRTRKSF